ncbi:hypothetical protein JOQ06_011734 [Pogonophryne albipinna]|nr:hypothetical protein JOQ06_011734 [Pogonophryne albipinna]
MLYNAVKNYKATKDDEITVAIGAVVEVLQKSDNGWWLVRYNGKAGYIPIMYLKPYKHPHIRMIATNQDRRNSSPNQLMPSLDQQSKGLSLSQGNLLQLPARSSTPKMQLPLLQQRSKSVDIQPYHPPAAPSAASITSSTDVDTSPTTPKPFPLPKIKVEMDGEDEPRPLSLQADSEGSLSDSSSFSDDLNSSWASSSSINLSQSYNEQELRLSRTPPPTAGPGDPRTLYHCHPQERSQSPTQTDILSR